MKLLILLPANVRSGVDFFQSLLDDHQQISQLPGFFYIDEFLNNINEFKNFDDVAKRFIELYENYFDSRKNKIERHNCLGVSKNEFYTVDKNKFIKYFKDLLVDKERNHENILKAINLAYSQASGKDISKIKLIIIQVHHIHRINIIKNLNFEILLTCRNPLSSFSSYMSNLAYFKKKIPLPWPFYYNCTRIVSCFKTILKLNKKSYLIKLEDLHVKNEITMRNFCETFDIEYDSCMTTSTFHKKLWWGDAVSTIDLNGVNKNFQEKIKEKNFYNKDILYIQYLFAPFFKKYDFKKIIHNQDLMRLNFFLPLKFELIIFFKNLINLKFITSVLTIYYYLKRLKNMEKLNIDILPKKI